MHAEEHLLGARDVLHRQHAGQEPLLVLDRPVVQGLEVRERAPRQAGLGVQLHQVAPDVGRLALALVALERRRQRLPRGQVVGLELDRGAERVDRGPGAGLAVAPGGPGRVAS